MTCLRKSAHAVDAFLFFELGQLLTSLEYENLVTALNLALPAQVSIENLFFPLSSYLDAKQDQRRGLELGQAVLSHLERYPLDKLAGALGYEFARVIDNIALRQLELKQYAAAEASYQKALAIWLENKSHNADEIKKRSASIYHQLGAVAREQRQWQQAEQYYQQALQIFGEYDDRYAQATIYGQLGILSGEQQRWMQAREYLLQALEIFVEYSDTYSSGIALRSLARVWRASNDASLPAAVANILGTSVEETEKLLREMLGGKPGEAGQ